MMNTSELNRIKLDNNEVAQTAGAADEEEAPAPSKSPFVRSKVVATWSTELSMSLSDWVRPLIGFDAECFLRLWRRLALVRYIILYLWRAVFLSPLEVSSCSELFVSYISCLSREMKRSRRKLFIVYMNCVSSNLLLAETIVKVRPRRHHRLQAPHRLGILRLKRFK